MKDSQNPAPHFKIQGLPRGKVRPAEALYRDCGLCDTYYIHYVKESCAFLNQQVSDLEEKSHGRSRNLDSEEDWFFGVHQHFLYELL